MTATKELPKIVQDEHEYLVHTYVRPDFALVRGEGITLFDEEGNAYQDWVAGIAVNALGYGDKGMEEVVEQHLESGILHVSNLYHTEPQVELAKWLVEHSFADRAFFCNSGTEANEGAIKFARKAAYSKQLSHKTKIVCFTNAFHGRTLGSLSVTPKGKYQDPFRPLIPDVLVVEYNNIEQAKAAIDSDTVAVIVEPIQGEGGINVGTTEFLQTLRQLCDEHDAVLIFDEVQCGMGRTGTLWAYESSDVQPDIMTLAKPLAGGFPIGAVLVTEEIASHIQPGDHGSTFAGGTLVTGVAKYVMERIGEPSFLTQVQEVGEYLMDRLSEINSPHIKEVRGRGLMVAVEMDVPVKPIIDAGYEQGLLLVNAGENNLRFIPPLVVTKQDVDQLIDKLTNMMGGLDD